MCLREKTGNVFIFAILFLTSSPFLPSSWKMNFDYPVWAVTWLFLDPSLAEGWRRLWCPCLGLPPCAATICCRVVGSSGYGQVTES